MLRKMTKRVRERESARIISLPSSPSPPPSHPSLAPLLLPFIFASLPSHRRKVINTLGRCVGEAHTPVDRGIAGVLCANLTIRLLFRGFVLKREYRFSPSHRTAKREIFKIRPCRLRQGSTWQNKPRLVRERGKNQKKKNLLLHNTISFKISLIKNI